MDFWQKARTFAEDAAKRSQEFTKEAAKRSQELTKEAAKRSQEFTIGSSKLSDIVLEASKRSKEIAAEASKKADLIKVEALKRADQIKSQIPSTSAAISQLVVADSSPKQAGGTSPEDLEKFGITDELREFVKEITLNTFRDFPLEGKVVTQLIGTVIWSKGENVKWWCMSGCVVRNTKFLFHLEDARCTPFVRIASAVRFDKDRRDDSEMSDIPTISNVRQDLTKWQEIHAKHVLSTVKEISKLRYELCPRVMRERKFWRIYFILVNSHVTPYEKRYMEEENKKSAEKVKDDGAVGTSTAETVTKPEENGATQKPKSAAASKSTDQDLDVFLLGDLGDSDEGPDDGNDGLDDDDFDKL
ncbi:hypothetical protein OSB04_004302 [Centaurea solstitialis]|uniref:BSD domain-containing protein n=1 Tax=Centaurea solstitialis TaxID=347529 RepID=A0AA38U8X2_9ASTR|nr:hypothetical protein OSB04_004302 [Centaurea solstitialis]